MRRISTIVCVVVVVAQLCTVQIASVRTATAHRKKAESKAIEIGRAVSAAPSSIATAAKVVERDDKERNCVAAGTNGFTCFSGHPGVIADGSFCASAAALQWEKDLADHKAEPTNTEPGIEYMLEGATDWSPTDPYATSGTPVKYPPHWMILWPFDPATTRLTDFFQC